MFIFHGDNQSASRQAFLVRKNTDKARNLHVVEFSGPNLIYSDLVNSPETVSLFGQQSLIVIEDFFTGKHAGREKEQIAKYLKENTSKDVLFWESKNVSMQLKSFPAGSIAKFDLPKHLFDYLETFSVSILHQTLEDSEPQVVLFLLVRQLQSLIAVSDGKVANLPDWKAAKLRHQAAKFTVPRLLQLHHQLLEIDYRQKNSLSPLDLAQALELWSTEAVN